MALRLGASHATTEAGVRPETVADLHQLSAVTAIAVIGICLSLMALTPIASEWLVAVQYGF